MVPKGTRPPNGCTGFEDTSSLSHMAWALIKKDHPDSALQGWARLTVTTAYLAA